MSTCGGPWITKFNQITSIHINQKHMIWEIVGEVVSKIITFSFRKGKNNISEFKLPNLVASLISLIIVKSHHSFFLALQGPLSTMSQTSGQPPFMAFKA